MIHFGIHGTGKAGILLTLSLPEFVTQMWVPS